jgi:hypothetical protein
MKIPGLGSVGKGEEDQQQGGSMGGSVKGAFGAVKDGMNAIGQELNPKDASAFSVHAQKVVQPVADKAIQQVKGAMGNALNKGVSSITDKAMGGAEGGAVGESGIGQMAKSGMDKIKGLFGK